MLKKYIFLLIIFSSTYCTRNIDVEKEKRDILETDRRFAALSIQKGTYEAFDRFMTDDAVLYRNNSLPVIGRDSIRSIFKNVPDKFVLKWEPYYADVAASGDLGYTLGKYEIYPKNRDSSQLVSDGYYVTIWRKQPNGTWKYVFDSGSESARR